MVLGKVLGGKDWVNKVEVHNDKAFEWCGNRVWVQDCKTLESGPYNEVLGCNFHDIEVLELKDG